MVLRYFFYRRIVF